MEDDKRHQQSNHHPNNHKRQSRQQQNLLRADRLYTALELKPDATDEDIKRAYRRLALKYHPDKNPVGASTELFKEINYAHSVLSCPKKRCIYDQYGDMGLKMMNQIGEEQMQFMTKPWIKWCVFAFTVLTCGCFGCMCCCLFCCGCCCNFCCGRFKPTNMGDFECSGKYACDEEESENGAQDTTAATIDTQPGSSSSSAATAPSPPKANENEVECRAIPMGPPPSYQQATATNCTATGNYGSTGATTTYIE